MTITVKFFASLREQVGIAETTLEATGPLSVSAVWQGATSGQPMPSNTLSAINMDYVSADELANDGDEVAFFPPVTGG
ncbi:MAG: MoaD/ThiS family protein [Gammaproteobacteria bacterium]|nr:MoaD/ThiS family protein [Gammaproteobacteria bacterium]